MNRSIPLLLALFAGCGVADADVPTPTPSPEPLSLDELTRVDVRGTASAIAQVLRDVQSLSPNQRAQAEESLQVLSVNCAFTRASVQLPFALNQVVMEVDIERIDPLVHKDWENLRRGLSTHVAVLETLGADLPRAGKRDFLSRVDTDAIIDLDTLLASPNPLLHTAALLEAIPDELPDATLELIRFHNDRLMETTGQPATLGVHIGGWHNALRRIEPFVADADTKATINAMIAPLDTFAGSGC